MSVSSKGAIYIINDLDFIIPLYVAKKINHRIQVIHYNTEIIGEDFNTPKNIQNFYAKHADFPDLIIECLKERAEWRRASYSIDKKIYVINNTIPFKKMNFANDNYIKKTKEEWALSDKPIIIYAGGATRSRQLNEIISCMDSLSDEVNFVFYCYGSEKAFSELQVYCYSHSKNNNFRLYKAITRDELLLKMQACDIGINYYQPDYSINHLYAAPTKFFEYMACGLHIISTDNEGINHIINEHRLGVCMNKDEKIEDAIRRCLSEDLTDRASIYGLFKDKYCYENDSKETICEIKRIIKAQNS